MIKTNVNVYYAVRTLRFYKIETQFNINSSFT